MDVSNVIRTRAIDYTVNRPIAPTNDKGYLTPGSSTALTLKSHVQPLTFQQIRNLKPGQNASDWRNIWSLSEIKLLDSYIIEGSTFTVERQEYWKEGGFYKAQATRVRDTL